MNDAIRLILKILRNGCSVNCMHRSSQSRLACLQQAVKGCLLNAYASCWLSSPTMCDGALWYMHGGGGGLESTLCLGWFASLLFIWWKWRYTGVSCFHKSMKQSLVVIPLVYVVYLGLQIPFLCIKASTSSDIVKCSFHFNVPQGIHICNNQ